MLLGERFCALHRGLLPALKGGMILILTFVTAPIRWVMYMLMTLITGKIKVFLVSEIAIWCVAFLALAVGL